MNNNRLLIQIFNNVLIITIVVVLFSLYCYLSAHLGTLQTKVSPVANLTEYF